MSTIDNVIEMLTNIIGVDAPPGVEPEEDSAEPGGERKRRNKKNNAGNESSNDDSEPEKLKSKVIESMKQRSRAKEETSV